MKLQNLIHILIAIVCIGLFPNAQAVVPAPDGGYPGGNTAEGQNALFSLTTGGYNAALGFFSLRSDTTGSFNTAIGAGTLLANIADSNSATGAGALLSNTTGHDSTANGAFALFSNTEGASNTAIGAGALPNNTTGSGNTALGYRAGLGVTTASSVICIGNPGLDVSNSCYIGQIFAQPVTQIGTPVLVDSDGKLGTVLSSRRFKHDIKPMDKASEALLALKPVTFHYKSDTKDTPQFGLIAEEVAEVNSDLIVREKKGEILSVRYDQVNAMLLNEFLKEHRRVEELKSAMAQQRRDFESAVAQQRKATEALVARLNEQEAQIQKVSAKTEVGNSGSQMLVKNQ